MKRHMPSTNVNEGFTARRSNTGLHPSKQERCGENAAVPEGLFIEEEKLVKFTLMSKVLKFLFGF